MAIEMIQNISVYKEVKNKLGALLLLNKCLNISILWSQTNKSIILNKALLFKRNGGK